jgi:HlyD family secretion protein
MTKLPKSISSVRFWIIFLALTATIVTGIAIFKSFSYLGVIDTPTPTLAPQPEKIGALGRLIPHGKVIRLSASPTLEGARIKSLLVTEGDQVNKGQLIAILDNVDRLQTALLKAKQEVNLVQTQLEKVLTGASSTEIEAQKTVIKRLNVEKQTTEETFQAMINTLEIKIKQAQTDYERFDYLYQTGAIAALTRDQEKLNLDQLQGQLKEVKANKIKSLSSLQGQIKEEEANLNQIAEVSSIDVKIAQSQVANARATLAQAEANLELAYVRSPQDGQILQINSRAGENISEQGIVEIGATQQMEIIAEVYQSDLKLIKINQKAIILSDIFPDNLTATVVKIGTQIKRQNILTEEAGSDVDRRIVEVTLQFNSEDSQKVQNLTNLQVEVLFLIANDNINN